MHPGSRGVTPPSRCLRRWSAQIAGSGTRPMRRSSFCCLLGRAGNAPIGLGGYQAELDKVPTVLEYANSV